MRIGFLGRILLVSSLLVGLACAAGIADDRARFARETGLDIDLVSVIQIDVDGIELTIVFVFVNDRTFASKISPALRAQLLPYVGQNAIYVNPNIKSVVSEFDFDPIGISVRPASGESFLPGRDAWTEITSGFLDGRFEVNPAGAAQGSGSEGILVLGEAIDPTAPFELLYNGERASFSIAAASATATTAGTGPAAATASHQPIEVAPLEDVATLENVLSLPDFSSETLSTLLAIPPEDVEALEIQHFNDEILRLLYVRLEDGIRGSALGEDLVERLEPLIGTGAVMVWAFSPTGVGFSPWNFFVRQSGTNYVFFSSASFVELTPDFVGAKRISANGLVAGVIRLPRGADPGQPFEIFYSSSGATFP